MVNKILIALVVIVVGLVVVVALQPAEFRVSRTATVDAPTSAIFAQVNDFRRWSAWSPYDQRDPAMKRTYSGAAGTGAVYAWDGNKEVGAGRATITESRPNDLIRIKLEFMRPFTATNTAEFAFTPAGNHTAVTWSLSGQRNFVTKAVGLAMDMDKMIGGDFEQGLAQLKRVVEAAPKQ